MDTEESTENAGVDPTKNPEVGSNYTDTSERTGVGNDDTSPPTMHEKFQESDKMGSREAASKKENGPMTRSRRRLEHYANLLFETTFSDMEPEAVFTFMMDDDAADMLIFFTE